MPVNSFENYPMSWKPTLQHSKKPLYLTLAEQLEQDIHNGTLRPGTKLPPQRELADFLDIKVFPFTAVSVLPLGKKCLFPLQGWLSALLRRKKN